METKFISPGLVNMRASQCITALNALWTHASSADLHQVWQKFWGFLPGTKQQSVYAGLYDLTRIRIRSSLTHAKTLMPDDVSGIVKFPMVSPDSLTSITCCQSEPAFICEANRGSEVDTANFCVLWRMPAELHGGGLWAQVPLKDFSPSSQSSGVCSWQFGQKYAQWAH